MSLETEEQEYQRLVMAYFDFPPMSLNDFNRLQEIKHNFPRQTQI